MKIIRNADMSRYTSFRTGGAAEILLVVECKDDIPKACAYCDRLGVVPVVLGGGTNVLISDKGISGACILIATRGLKVEGEKLTAAAGERLPVVSRFALSAGLSGLEFAAGIPGTVGGAAVGNAGAYSGTFGGVCEYVEVYGGGRFFKLSAAECGFSYRSSEIGGFIVTEAGFILKPDSPEKIGERMRENTAKRHGTQPHEPNAGSIFKATSLGAAGAVIDKLGLKGMRIGGAEVSRVHANFIINAGGAVSENIRELMERIEKIVYTETGIILQREVKLIGDF